MTPFGYFRRCDRKPGGTGGFQNDRTRNEAGGISYGRNCYIFSRNGHNLLVQTWQHLFISLSAVILGIAVAVPTGILLTRSPKVANFVIGVVSVLQTVPSLAILAFIIPFLGVGTLPAIIALFIYALLPILRNTFIGVRESIKI